MRKWNEINFKEFMPSKKSKTRERYIPLIGSFDIETSTVTTEEGNVSFMYIWQMAIDDVAYYGRTWEDFRECLGIIRQDLHLTPKCKLRVYVHNMKFDFSFFKTQVPVSAKDFLARDKHDIIQCIIDDVFEFRDSYCYSEKDLKDMGKECGVPKLDGYDYQKVRTSITPLTADELRYCENDVLILTTYFHEELRKYKTMTDIPFTATQKVKKVLWQNYREMGSKAAALALKLKENQRDRATLVALKSAYWGAFNFYNPIFLDFPIETVRSCDLDSAYASLALRKKYPMSKFQSMPIPESIDHLFNSQDFCYLITVKITQLKNRYPFVGYLPAYKTFHWQINPEELLVEQGKILYAKDIVLTITEVDLKIIKELYTWEEIEILSLVGAKKGFLPEYIKKSIVDVYQTKKKVKREQQEIKKHRELTDYEKQHYINVKSMVSRIYGVFVQDPEPILYKYDEESNLVESKGAQSIKSASELTNYSWGVWITAYCRYEMIKLLKKIAVDTSHGKEKYSNLVVYIDTDCIKCLESTTLNSIISQYNQNVKDFFKSYTSLHRIKHDTIDGLGELDVEAYKTLKILGRKKYVYIDDNDRFVYKISGLSKKTELFNAKTPEECIDSVKAEMTLPASVAHNSKCSYITYDEPKTFMVTDYLGNTSYVSVQSFAVIDEEGFTTGGSKADGLKKINPEKLAKKLKRR